MSIGADFGKLLPLIGFYFTSLQSTFNVIVVNAPKNRTGPHREQYCTSSSPNCFKIKTLTEEDIKSVVLKTFGTVLAAHVRKSQE